MNLVTSKTLRGTGGLRADIGLWQSWKFGRNFIVANAVEVILAAPKKLPEGSRDYLKKEEKNLDGPSNDSEW
ncbi:Copia protein [Durusdinium trenchii]|uniref:Copia protein n=1 Tax=Durusdinium trenchii TaxID=1381693 RepID=A0ABP0NGW6_9DINO